MTTQHAIWASEKTNVRHALQQAGFTVDVVEDGLNRVVLLARRGEVRNVIVGRPPNGKRPVSAFWLFKEASPAISTEEFIEATLTQTEAGARNP